MDFEACFQLGYVSKVHGVKGEVQCFLDVDVPENYRKMESVFVDIDNKLVPFFIEHLSLQGQRAVVKFEDVDSIEQAETLKSKGLYLPLEKLPALEEDQFYFHEIVGYKVEDAQEGVLGIVKGIYELPHQDLIAMEFKGKEVLIPIADEIIRKVSHNHKTLHVELPAGLLQIYLDE